MDHLNKKNCTWVETGGGFIFELGGNIIYSYALGLDKKWIVKHNGLSLGTLVLSSIECTTLRKWDLLILRESKKYSYPSYKTWNW